MFDQKATLRDFGKQIKVYQILALLLESVIPIPVLTSIF